MYTFSYKYDIYIHTHIFYIPQIYCVYKYIYTVYIKKERKEMNFLQIVDKHNGQSNIIA